MNKKSYKRQNRDAVFMGVQVSMFQSFADEVEQQLDTETKQNPKAAATILEHFRQ